MPANLVQQEPEHPADADDPAGLCLQRTGESDDDFAAVSSAVGRQAARKAAPIGGRRRSTIPTKGVAATL